MGKNTDWLNAIMIAISLYLAFELPFELFLFSYAVLGPLHYLTEINWLRQKNYFSHNTRWVYILIVLVAIITVPYLRDVPILKDLFQNPALYAGLRFIPGHFGVMILGSLLFAIGLITFKKPSHLAAALALSFASAYFLLKLPGMVIVCGIFLPTLIHVYLFTMLFMIYGSLKNPTTPGVLAIVALALVPFIIALSPVDPSGYAVGSYSRNAFAATGFASIHLKIWHFFKPGQDFSFLTPLIFKIQIFLAFAYTYHYLNWFSKTTVIGWHRNLNTKKALIVTALWLCCIGLYAHDYKTGMIALTFLSFSHVFLEFPLNAASIKGIANHLKHHKSPDIKQR